MKTDELIALLSNGVAPVDRGVAARRFGVGLPLAAAASFVMTALIFHLRPDLASVTRTALFWEKLALPLCIGIGALLATLRLARPGAAVGSAWYFVIAPIIAVWIAGLFVVSTAAPHDIPLLLLGYSWRSCPFNILLLSIPGFIATFLAVRALAPTRLRAAGAVAGLLASSIATVAYCFHCPEMSPAFWSIWYLLGMALGTAVGALLGPKLLRW